MQVTLQYFSKKEDRELDMLLKIAFGGAGFTFVRKVLDKGGSCMDYVFENTSLADPDERLACIDCTLGTFKSRVDSKGRCLVCQQEEVSKPLPKTSESNNPEQGILQQMVDANVGDLVRFSYGSERNEEVDIAVRKISSRITLEKPVKETDFSPNTKSPGRLGEDVEL